jgi:hypothetical protein
VQQPRAAIRAEDHIRQGQLPADLDVVTRDHRPVAIDDRDRGEDGRVLGDVLDHLLQASQRHRILRML